MRESANSNAKEAPPMQALVVHFPDVHEASIKPCAQSAAFFAHATAVFATQHLERRWALAFARPGLSAGEKQQCMSPIYIG